MKEEAPENVPFMWVTDETFQPERSPSEFLALRNMSDMSVTFERSGTSVVLYAMLLAPANAPDMVIHFVPPHCSIDSRWSAFEVSPERLIL